MPRRWETGSRHITNSEFGAAPILCHRLLQISKKFGTQNCSYGVFISAKFQLSWSWRISLLLPGKTEAMCLSQSLEYWEFASSHIYSPSPTSGKFACSRKETANCGRNYN